MSKSKAHRRSGSAVFEFLEQSGITPTCLYLAGVGVSHDDASVFHEIWPSSYITGFEPNPISYQGLKETFPGTVLPYALSDTKASRPLYYSHSWKNGSSLYPPEIDNRRLHSTLVDTVRLGDYFFPEGGLLWLDCEGEELAALRGAGIRLSFFSAINIEITGRPRGDGWSSPLDVHRYLIKHGFYQAYVHTIRTVRAQFDAIYVRKEHFNPDTCSCLDSLDRWKSDTNQDR